MMGMTTTTHAAHGRRQLLFLACVCALVAQAGLGLLAYQTLSATPIVVAGLIGYGVGESIASIVTVGCPASKQWRTPRRWP
jgi:hypothetical protein